MRMRGAGSEAGWAGAVVLMDPGWQGAVAGGVGAVQPPIGPLLQQGAVEPLDLAVGLRPIGSGALVAHTSVGQRHPEQPAAVADAVVGQHPSDGHAVQREPAVGAAPEPGAGRGPIVTRHTT